MFDGRNMNTHTAIKQKVIRIHWVDRSVTVDTVAESEAARVQAFGYGPLEFRTIDGTLHIANWSQIKMLTVEDVE